MPRDMIFKRRFLTGRAQFPSPPPPPSNIAPSKDRQNFDEDRAMSDYSSDSGRESTLPGELGQLSPSVSFDASRPAQLNLGQGSITSSTSSDSLPAKSPLSPMHPMGHISSLPRILRNLAVSGNQQEITDMHQLSFVQGEQTSGRERQLAQPPCYVDARKSGGQCPLTVQLQHPTPLPPASSFLSPNSRKRTNSVTNAVDNATPNANTSSAAGRPAPKHRKIKGGRQVAPDKLTSSPITGTIIREVSQGPLDNVIIVRRGDVDRSINVVEITDEKRAAIAKIENTIGDYVCRLCKVRYEDVFALAGHNCPQIVHLEYQCPECGKSFHCPANLASHRRWHKPKVPTKRPSARNEAVEFSPKTPSLSKSSSNSSIPEPILALSAGEPETDAPNTFIEKPSRLNVPFKKRFFFQKDADKSTAITTRASTDTKEDPWKDSMSPKIPAGFPNTGGSTDADNGLSTYETLLQGKMVVQDAQNHRCGLCGMLLQGVQNYAHHWQSCLPAAVRRNWPAVLCKVPK